jgi:hypothetical protein
VGYIYTSDNMAISAESAELFLQTMKEKRIAEPIMEAQEDPTKQIAKKRKREQQKARAACDIVYESTANKKLSDLTVKGV